MINGNIKILKSGVSTLTISHSSDLDTLTFSELRDLDTLTLLERHNLETLTFSERCIARAVADLRLTIIFESSGGSGDPYFVFYIFHLVR